MHDFSYQRGIGWALFVPLAIILVCGAIALRRAMRHDRRKARRDALRARYAPFCEKCSSHHHPGTEHQKL